MLKSLKPREDKFFELFIVNAKLSVQAAIKLNEFMQDLSDGEEKYKVIKEIENECDRQVHAIFEQLNRTFITPLDREDIHMIAKSLDEVTDMIEQTASRFLMYNIDKSTPEAMEVSVMIVKCTKELLGLMETLRESKGTKELKKWIIEINNLEEQGDANYRKSITKLFHSETPAIEVIQWKDIYENLEKTLDACEDVANVIEGVVMKHA